MVPEQSEGTTNVLRVINSVDSLCFEVYVTYLDHRRVIIPLPVLLVTRKQCENVAVMSNNITWLLINLSKVHHSQCYVYLNHATCFI